MLSLSDVLSKDAPSVSYNYTPLWTAPEVLVGDYNSKARSPSLRAWTQLEDRSPHPCCSRGCAAQVDIWSLGCVLIEMASGKPPWSEQNFENPFRALYHIGESALYPYARWPAVLIGPLLCAGNSNSIPKIPDSLSETGKSFLQMCLQR
jgi:serine/threonine protein kinase